MIGEPCLLQLPYRIALTLVRTLLRFLTCSLAPALLLVGAAQGQLTCDQDLLVPQSPTTNQHFGAAIVAQGVTAFVGSIGAGGVGAPDGAVHAFTRVGGTWQPSGVLHPAAPNGSLHFGLQMDFDGSTLIVSSYGYRHLHFFERTPSAWTEVTYLDGPQPTPFYDNFGNSVAVAGDWAAVGASRRPNPMNQGNAGAVFLYHREPQGWVEQGVLYGPTPNSGDNFGSDVSLSADGYLAVGAPDDFVSGLGSRGAVHVYKLGSTGWEYSQRLSGSSPKSGVGSAVDLSGDRLAFTAPGPYGLGPLLPPATYLFERNAQGAYQELDALFGDYAHETWSTGLCLGSGGTRLSLSNYRGEVPYADGRGYSTLLDWNGAGWDVLARRWASPDSGSLSLATALGDETQFLALAEVNNPSSIANRVLAAPTEHLLATPFCFCDVAACANHDLNAGCVNETGFGADLSVCGSTSATRDTLALTCSNLAPGRFGTLLIGLGTQPAAFFGNGRLCLSLGSGLLRLPTQSSSPEGTLAFGPGLLAQLASTAPGFGPLSAGSTAYFQCWYRDTGACLTGFNVSNGLEVQFGL